MPVSPLPPIYFAAPSVNPVSAGADRVDELGEVVLTTPELRDGDVFEVVWYSQVDQYFLIHWRWMQAGVKPLRSAPTNTSGTEGESLYFGEELLAWDWYELQLGVYDAAVENLARIAPDPRIRINQSMGAFGLSVEAATKLRSPAYRMTFI